MPATAHPARRSALPAWSAPWSLWIGMQMTAPHADARAGIDAADGRGRSMLRSWALALRDRRHTLP